MSDYQGELSAANAQGAEAYATIAEWLDRPISGSEAIPTAELERRVKQLRASRARLFALEEAQGKVPDIIAALETNASYFHTIGVTLPEDN